MGIQVEMGALEEIVRRSRSESVEHDVGVERVLAKHELPSPVKELTVTLRPNLVVSGLAGYVLQAELSSENGNSLHVTPSDYPPNLNLQKLQPIASRAAYLVGSKKLLPHTSLMVFEWPGEKGLLVSLTSVYGGKQQQALREFANAVQSTVSSAYKCAGKDVPGKSPLENNFAQNTGAMAGGVESRLGTAQDYAPRRETK